jgi:hypothetical protein
LRIVRRLALAAMLAAPLAASAAAPAAQFSAERFKAHVAYLSDDLLEGREAGTRGYDLAARYVASQFAQLGLSPGGENGTWYQQVPLAQTTLADPPGTLVVSNAKGSKTFANGSSVILRGVSGGGVADVSAPVVFVGYGITDPVSGVDDYKGLDVAGKVVVILRAVPPGIDSEIGAHMRADQGRNAAAHGAVAAIQIFTRSGSRLNPWPTLAADAALPSTGWVGRDGVVRGGSITLKATATIDIEPAAMMFDGAPQTLDEVLDAVSAGHRPPGFALPATIQMKVATTSRRYESPEVIGLIRGSDPMLRGEYVVLMAHLDHLGIRPGPPDPIYNGALDNAAGVATLLEISRALAASPKPPRRSVLVIANTAEEKGLLGADFFARYPTVPLDKIVAAVDIDQPVLTYPFIDVVPFGGSHSTLYRSVTRAAAAMKVKLAPDFMPEQAVFVRSDHYPLARAGVPAVMLVTGPGNGGEAAWAKYMAQNYHRPSDDMNLPILWDQGARFAELNYRVVRELADRRERPLWYAGDYFGELFAPGEPKAKR